MIKRLFFVFLTAILVTAILAISAKVYEVWATDVAWEETARTIGNVKAVFLDNRQPAIIFAGTDSGVWKSSDSGRSWSISLRLQGADRAVNFLTADPADLNQLYAATTGGLYATYDRARTWKRIFRGRNALEEVATVLFLSVDTLYLGTKEGLFISRSKGKSWARAAGKLGSAYITSLAQDVSSKELFVASSDGIFKTIDSGGTWERVIVSFTPEDNFQEETDEGTEANSAQEDGSILVRHILPHPFISGYIYAATNRGVYVSKDRGESWSTLAATGLLSRGTYFLAFSPQGVLHALTESGLFCLEAERWNEMSLRLFAKKFNSLAFDKRGNLYLATDKGLFMSKHCTYVLNNHDIISLYCNDEPTIKEVQQAAIKYAEVDPAKIKEWRSQAAKKALLPQVNIGLDRNSTDLWHWETGSTTKSDDDALRRGKDCIDWGVSLSWDLGEIIWNGDQTSIDVRSRLMVELRDDILDEITKIYFERIRRKMELDNLAIEDRKKRFEKELNIQELTALLDAMTGGYFSSHQDRVLKPIE